MKSLEAVQPFEGAGEALEDHLDHLDEGDQGRATAWSVGAEWGENLEDHAHGDFTHTSSGLIRIREGVLRNVGELPQE